jgi:hypothetical protein
VEFVRPPPTGGCRRVDSLYRGARRPLSRLFIATLACLALFPASDGSSGATYYVDCAAGSDAAAGTSADVAWRTPGKVSATTFAPGDAILFRRGTRCPGLLWPKGSGDEGRPIRIGAYGRGARPIIDGGGEQAALKLFNQQGWEIDDLETTGGNPHGLFIGGDAGRLKHFRVRNTVVHDVTGEPKVKHTGLVVIAGSGGATLEDIVVDGVVAHHTTQWAGVIVLGASSENRARGVVVRNTIVHDVFGDGIVFFQVEDGLIEKSAAWLTGLQPKETIGTPNGIWTWRCRRCTVQLTEGFFVDSPGVDGGVYDIDWGNDDNIVQHNYAHDAQGYCASVFGAEKEVTTNSIVRYNVCVNNGRSPKLARRQGDVYLTTWAGGSIDGVLIHNNTFFWNPPINVPAVQVDEPQFSGSRPNRFFDNVIHSAVPAMISSNTRLQFDGNVYWYPGSDMPTWSYGEDERATAVGGAFVNPRIDGLLRPGADSPLVRRNVGALAFEAGNPVPAPQPGRWTLNLFSAAAPSDARSQLVFLEAALAQYGDTRLDAVIVGDEQQWPVVRVRRGAAERPPDGELLALVSPSGDVVRRWRQFAPPADLGLILRHVLGPPRGSPAVVP